ncbi:MAG: hypothetical protein V1880_01495 [Patescibacteria group bacterium]
MKKFHLTIAAVTLCVLYGVLSWDLVTHSEPPGPEDSQFAEICKGTTTSNTCCIDYNEAMEAVKRDWQENLKKLIDQEKPASEMVDDGYESLRTYDCWLEYICRAVQYSGHAPIESAYSTGLESEHLGIVPGCQAPENLRMESEYNKFVETMKDVPITGVPIEKMGQAFIDNKISYFPRCQTDNGQDNRSPNLVAAKSNYDACKRALELNFGCPKGVDEALCPEFSNAFVTLENVLKKTNADQKASALERKLGTILPKMHEMEMHVGYLDNFLQQLDSRFSCYAAKCD